MLRWGILGTSFISDTMATAIASSPHSNIAAVAGRDPAKLSAFAVRHEIGKTHVSCEALIEDPDVDVVYVGLPNNLHRQMTEKAAAAGKPILSEKSLTTSMEDATALASAVRAGDVFFMEGLMYLCHPLIARLGDVLRSGRLGAIRAIHGSYAADIANVVNPLGKGTLYNLGCYPASLLHYVMQTAFGPEAFADRTTGGHGNLSPQDGNICDAVLSVRFSNGVLATLQSTDSYGMAWEFSIHGERGMVRFLTNPWLPTAGRNVFVLEEYGSAPEEYGVETGQDAFQHQVACVETCLREGRKEPLRPAARLADSLEIMSLLTAWEHHCRSTSPDPLN